MPRQSPELSPSLTASSSASTFASSSYQPERLPKEFGSEFDVAMDQTMEITDYLLAIDEEDHSNLSQTHSPTTMSPNQTPSPVLGARSPVAWSPSDHLAFPSSPAAGPSTSFPDFSFEDEFAKMPEAGPSSLPMEPPTIKQEPVEFGWSDALPAVVTQPQLDLNTAAAVVPPVMATAAAATQPAPLPANYNLTPQDQAILMELLRNLTDQTMQAMLAPKTIAPSDLTKTVDPALLANAPPTPISPPIAAQATVSNPAVPAPAQAPAQPAAPSASVPAKRRVSEAVLDDIAEDEPLNAVSPEDEAKARRDRSMSTFDMHDLDLEAKLDMLVPSEAIFSAGRGKGGKKGGGMSSVVRGDDEDLDEDDSWRPSPEEYKKLSSKEKRQLRNKLSARAFRTRRKDYISTLEGHIKDRDAVIDAIKAELVNTRSENLDLKKELDALKSSAMTVLHPETAFKPSPAPAATANVVMASTSAQLQANKPAGAPAPTPKFSTRKDLPSSPAIAKSFWGGGNGPLGHHGNMTVHTLFTPEVGLPPVRPIDASRENLNPLLNDSSAKQRYRTYPLAHSTAGAADMSSSFAEWSEDNAFSLRSLDSYRTQMWSRLTREAHAEKMGIAAGSRAKFFTPRDGKAPEPPTESTSTSEHPDLAARLADSVISAFAHPYGSDSHSPLTDIVTGKSRSSHDDKEAPIDKEEENRRKKLSPTYEADEQLAMALGGLRLQSGFTSPREYRGALAHSWDNPMGALADMLTFGLGPTGRA